MSQRILVIEDNEQDQKIIKRYLTKSGFGDATVVQSGELGIAEAAKISPEIILVDTMLPGIDGFETCSQLKNLKHIHPKIIMMTGRIDAVDAAKARRMGADDYCAKTSDCSVLLETIRKVTNPEGASATADLQSPAAAPTVEHGGDISWGLAKTNEAIKLLYKELERKNEELKELDHLKSKFISTVSHELRTPLTIIQGAVQQVEEGLYGEINEEQKKRLAMAYRAADRLKYIINDLLDVVKLESKQVRITKESVDLTSLARETVLSFHPILEKKGLKVELSFNKESIVVAADRHRIAQVLTNLVNNAIKFTSKGKLEIIINDHPHMVECQVRDNGQGIAEADLTKVFGRFQQFGDLNAREREGTGLGLSICKDIIELHDGTITVESELNKGTTFIFTLPKPAAK